MVDVESTSDTLWSFFGICYIQEKSPLHNQARYSNYHDGLHLLSHVYVLTIPNAEPIAVSSRYNIGPGKEQDGSQLLH